MILGNMYVYYRVRSADGWFLGLHCLFRLLAGLLWLLMAEPSAKWLSGRLGMRRGAWRVF